MIPLGTSTSMHQYKAFIARGQWLRFVLSAITSSAIMLGSPNTFPSSRLPFGSVLQIPQRQLSSPSKLRLPLPRAAKHTESEGLDDGEQYPDDDCDRDSEEAYARRYTHFYPEHWEDEDDKYGRFDAYFNQREGNYIHPMIDRIDELRESVREASKDVRARDITIANLAETILQVAGQISQISAAAQESVPGGAKAIVEGLGKIEATLAQAFENDGLGSVGCVGEVFDPTIHKVSGDDNVVTGTKPPSGSVEHVFKVGFKMKDQVVRRAEVVVSKNIRRTMPGLKSNRRG
jgi:molecular chaperone GrpE (heat shock protein)